MSECRYLGVDVGSTTTEAVVISAAGEVVGRARRLSGADPAAAAASAAEEALAGRAAAGRVGTGYGRRLVQAERTLTEITCLALGARAEAPAAAGVLDIGGQDAKFVWLTADGRPAGFALNDRCAAGTGRFLELAAERLGVPLSAWGTLAAGPPGITLSATCGIFAESELVGHLAAGTAPAELVRAATRSVALRLLPLLSQAGRPALEGGEIAAAGGVARNPLVIAALAEELGRMDLRLRPLPEPEFTVAHGAALAARRLGL